MKLTKARTPKEFIALVNKRHKELHPECEDIKSRQINTVLTILFEVIVEMENEQAAQDEEKRMKEWEA
jgi:hypothetical protein